MSDALGWVVVARDSEGDETASCRIFDTRDDAEAEIADMIADDDFPDDVALRPEPVGARPVSESAGEVERLRDALQKIVDHYPTLGSPQFDSELAAVRVEIDACPGCEEAKRRKWPPSNLCGAHYLKWHRIIYRRDYDQGVRKWSEPKAIARAALAGEQGRKP